MDNLWTIRIFFDGDAADPAVYPLKSCSIPRCVGAAGTHAQQKATVSISGPTVSLSLKLVGRKEQTKAEIYEGTAIRFTGLIDTDWDFDAKGRLIESVSLTVMDYSGKLKIGVFGKDVAPENARLVRGPQRWQNYAVCDPASQDTSIVHQILKLAAGFLGITIPVKCDATCTTRLDYFQLEQDPDLKTQLEQLLKEFRLDYIFDADNSIRIISTDSTGEPVATVTDFRNSLRGSGSVYKPKSIKATWRKYERRVGEKIGEGYHKSDSVNSRSVEYGQDVTWSLPDGANLDDLEIVSIENLNPGSTWTETGVTHPRIDGASAKITSYDLEGCHIVMERHGACAKGYIRARITADIVIRYNKTQELYSNPGTTQESLTLLHHHQLSSSDGIEGATEYAMYYEAMKRKASTTYTFSSLSEYAPGAIVTLSESSVTGISAKVRILEQTLDPLTGIYKYKAEGAGDLDLKEAITKAETSEDHPIYGGDFLELSADLDESTGVVTVVAEGDAIDYYGLTPAWNLNGTSVTSTGLSVTFPVRDLALSGNVVTCTATLNGETVTATYDIDQLLSAPTLAIFTGDGSLFPAGLVNATLSAVLMRSGVDVALANESVFRWARTSSDTVADATWNASAKATGKRSIIITDSDLVNGKAVFTVSCTIGTITYTSAGFSVVTVSDGQNGWSNATCQLFKRSASAPSAYDGKQLTYTFATATLTGNTGTWSRTIPSGDDPLYVIYASAFAAADTDIVETTDWTAPAILSENGTVGQSGMSVKTILLYQRSETAPALPTGQVTYNFDSGKISGQGAWSLDVPTTNGSPLWVISATAASRSASDIIEPSEWSTQSIMAKDGEQGPQGEQGAKGDTGEAGPKGETGATGTSIIGIVEEYALSSSSSSVTGSWGTAVPTLSPTDKYLWNRSKTMYSDGTSSAYTTAVVIGVYGDTGKAMTYMYASAPEGLYPGGYPFGTDQNVIGMADTAIGINYEWHDTVPDIADGYVLWTKTTAPDGTVSIYRVQGPKGEPGETGPQGPTGATGATGRGISGITEYYLASASSTAPSASDTGWSTSAQTPTTAKPYLWNKTVVTYTSGSPTTTIAMIGQSIKGNPGATGATGNGIKSVTVSYGVSSSASAQPTSWSSTIPAVAENQYLWTRTITDYTSDSVSDTVTYTYAKQGKSGSAGTSVTVSSIQYQAGTSATTAPTGTWSSNPVSVAQGQFLWTKTTFSDGKVAYGVARQGADGAKGDPGETGSSAKDFTLYQSATYFEVSPRGVTHKMQVISITCVPLNLTSPTITWSVSSAVPTQAISSDKTVLSLTVQSGVALSDMTVACAVSGIGTKSITILSTPTGENGPLYLGTDWDESATTTSEGDPLESGDYYLRLSDTMVRVYSGTEWRDVSAATSTHKMMQDALSDVLKHGADVKSTSSVLYAYVGNLVAQSASIKRLSTEVITSANYAETNGSPATGYKLDGPNDKIKTVGMIASEGIFRNVNISGGSMSVFNANNQTVFKTADRTATANVIDISVPSGNSFYSLKRIIDSMATKPATESPDYKKLRTDAATIEGVSFDGIVYQTAGKRRTIILGHDLQCDSRTGALKYSNFAETPTHTIVKGSDGYYGIKECHIDIYGVDTIFCTLGRGGNKWNGKNAYIMLYSSSGVLLKSATSSDAGYIALEYGGVIPVGSYAVAYVDSESYGLYYDWYFESRFPELAPEFGYGILFFNADATSESNYYRLVNTYSNTPFTISKIRGSAVSVSTADYLTALPVADIISMIATTGTYISVDSTSSTYSSTDQTQVSLSELIVTRNMLSLQPINGTNIVLSVGDVVDNPVIHFEVIGEREGIAVSNINAINEYGEIATSGLMFANIWTGKIDNINVCDSDNQVLSTSSQSIVGAINELKSDFGVRYPIFHGSLCPPSTPLLEIGEIPVFTATSLTKYRYFCVSGYMDSGAENMPETHRFVLFDANGNTTKLGRIFLNITLQEQLVITGISYGSSGDANAFLGGLVVQFNAENYLHKMTCSQYGRIIVSGTAIQSMTQYTIKDIWLE